MNSSANIKRLVKDVANIHKDPLTNDGIFYIHDDTNMMKGYAMIIGPTDTPYEYGFFFFTFQFPSNYPHSPPLVTYKTNDGYTRYNPNFYRNGKVCLSILNTWRGEGWTSCQTIRSILLTLLTTLNEKPLLNEPGIKETSDDVQKYNEIIEYKSLQFAHLGVLENMDCIEKNTIFTMFCPFMIEYTEKHYENILNKIKVLSEIEKNKVCRNIRCTTYNIGINIDYVSLIEKYKNFHIPINNKIE